MPNGFFEIVLAIIEIPVIPPSMIEFGKRNHSIAKAASVEPKVMTNNFFIKFVIILFIIIYLL